MTRSANAVIAFAIAVLGIYAACAGPESSAYDPTGDRFVVHEWGTFTSMQGAPGQILEGLQHESDLLPSFVYSRTEATESPFRLLGDESYDTPNVRRCTGKMETPVLYFYSATGRHVDVHVDFTDGLLTQWYPVSRQSLPALDPAAPIDLASIRTSSLDWSLDLLPFGARAPNAVPAVADDEPWAYAREVGANWLTAGNEAEQYVFYRGLGRMSVPIQVKAALEPAVMVTNTTPDAIPVAFAVEMHADSGRFVQMDAIAAGETGTALLGNTPLVAKADAIASLEWSMQTALVDQGLYEDEARAMVRTWSQTWFGQEGTRILYFVPTAQTERTIPLSIEPAPEELVRVLIGRLEYLTPTAEAEIEQALRDRVSPDAAVRDAAMARLTRLGRFLEPAVRGLISSRSNDWELRLRGQELLADLQGR